MRRLPKPTITAHDVVSLCANSTRNQDHASKLTDSLPYIQQAESNYNQQAIQGQLFSILETDDIAGITSKALMTKIYKELFSKQGTRPRRRIYDAIKLAPANGICPLCGLGVVSTLDHYLAQTKHPALTLTPINLVPACKDCNKAKSDRQPCSVGDQTLHPYYDDECEARWLFARILETLNPTATFYIVPPNSWPTQKQDRVLKHFEVFELNKLYSSNAGNEMAGINSLINNLYAAGGEEAVREHLTISASSWKATHINSWQGAVYESLSESDWYCSLRFRL